jgi:hypothetical protein
VHTEAVVTNSIAAWQFKMMKHSLYSHDPAPASFFLFSRVKRGLAGQTVTQETLKKEWEGKERCHMYKIADSYAEKTKIQHFLPTVHTVCIIYFGGGGVVRIRRAINK